MEVKKFTIENFNGGMKDSRRDSFSSGASLIKNFDIYTDKQKLIPVAGFKSLVTDEEKAYGLKAIGGIDDTIYGIGSGLESWYSSKWPYRVEINPHSESEAADEIVVNQTGEVNSVAFTTLYGGSGGISFGDVAGSQVINKAIFKVRKVGNPGDLTVSIYETNPGIGSPLTLIGEIGTVPAHEIDTFYQLVNVLGDDITLFGDYHVVFRATGMDGNNYYEFPYTAGSGSYKLSHETALDAWTIDSTSTTPYIKLIHTLNENTYNFQEDTMPVLLFDLSDMPSTFWDHVNEDGGDIRVTTTSGAIVYHSLRGFDRDEETGFIWIKGNLTDSFHIYYGKTNGDSNDLLISESAPTTMNELTFSGFKFFFHFDGDTENGVNNTQDLGSNGIFGDGYFGQGLVAGSAVGEDDDGLGQLNDDFVIGFLIYVPSGGSSVVSPMIEHSGTNFGITLTAADKITFNVNGSVATTTTTGTAALVRDKWQVVLLHYLDGDHYHYINGLLDLFSNTDDGDLDESVGHLNISPNFSVSGHVILDSVFAFNKNEDLANFASDWNKMIRHTEELWTIGSQEALDDHIPEYGGTQIYVGNLTDGEWEEYISSDQPSKLADYFPVNGFIELSNDGRIITVVSQEDHLGGLLLQAIETSTNPLDETGTVLTTYNDDGKAQPVNATPVDKAFYFTIGGTVVYQAGDPAVTGYTAYSNVQSMEPYQNYLAIASTRRSKGAIELWDLVNDDPIEFIDLGVGFVRVVGVAGDVLFGVVNGFIEDEVLSAKKPTMEIKRYVGGGRCLTTHRFEIPTNTDADLVESWEMPISQLKTRFKDFTLFYAKLPTDSTGEEFNEGLYAVGKNELTDELEVSLYVETDSLGDLEYMHSIANQLVVIHNRDGSVSRLRDDSVFSLTSRYETLVFDDGDAEKDKKLVGVELYFEELPEGQTVSMFYRINGETTWVKLFDHAVVGTMTRECVLIEATEEELPLFKEIEFAIQSIGGGAPITGYGFLIETTENNLV